VDVLVDVGAALAEGPIWDAAKACLWWVDVPAGSVHGVWPATGRTLTVQVGQPVGSLAPRRDGGLVLALRDGFGVLDDGAASARLLVPVEADRPRNQMNDGGVDPAGRFWAGTTSKDRQPGAGTLYRLDPDGEVTAVVTDVGLSNGIGWSPDGARMYYVDSLAQGLDVFDFDAGTGEVTRRRRLVTLDRATGIPDGLAVDVDGCVWLAVWGSSRVLRCTPAGRVDRAVTLPVAQLTSCAFGGEDHRDLFVTSAAEGLSPQARAAQPLAGAVFVTRPGPQGLAVPPYAG
jgi:sugar lactone lactonase YvrE